MARDGAGCVYLMVLVVGTRVLMIGTVVMNLRV